MPSRLRFTADDLWLALMVAIWGLNLSVLKVVFRQVTPLAANAVRFAVSSLAFVGLILWLEGARRRPGDVARDRRRGLLEPGDWPRVVGLGLLGHTGYQMCFVLGLNRTTATHSALIFGTSPLVVALLSTWMGHERVGWSIWAGLVSSATGVALTVSGQQNRSGQVQSTLSGDALILTAVLLWAGYSVLSKPLLSRYSPLRLTGLTIVGGTLPLVLVAVPDIARLDWGAVGLTTWAGLAFSTLLAVVLCYVIWYRSVARVGNARTAVYGNLVPVAGAGFAAWLLGERVSGQLALGAIFIFGGIALTRWSQRQRPHVPPQSAETPAEPAFEL
jgi:drug/metabolite transporter (DMT)-like permease